MYKYDKFNRPEQEANPITVADRAIQQSRQDLSSITTIQGVVAYLHQNGDTISKRDIANFEYLLEHLYENEVIHIAFTGMFEAETTDKRRTITGSRKSQGSGSFSNAAFAFTNERLIYARKAGTMGTIVFGGSYVKSIDIDEIRKISSYSRLLIGSIVLETITNTIRIQHSNEFTPKMAEIIRRFVEHRRKEQKHNQSVPIQYVIPSSDVADEIRKFKQLEIDGIITHEEFETKKRELLATSNM